VTSKTGRKLLSQRCTVYKSCTQLHTTVLAHDEALARSRCAQLSLQEWTNCHGQTTIQRKQIATATRVSECHGRNKPVSVAPRRQHKMCCAPHSNAVTLTLVPHAPTMCVRALEAETALHHTTLTTVYQYYSSVYQYYSSLARLSMWRPDLCDIQG
jgi:hypothetical protein